MRFFSTSVCSCLNSNSDDNLLKNIELFDRLSLSFNGRVLFIKDVIGDEICCWSFYGQGRKLAEVCCTSIVYATEKKQTKVRMSWDVFSLSRALQYGSKGLIDREGWKKLITVQVRKGFYLYWTQEQTPEQGEGWNKLICCGRGSQNWQVGQAFPEHLWNHTSKAKHKKATKNTWALICKHCI